jgi:hypothetical protein
VCLGLAAALRIDGPDFDVSAGPTLRRSQLEHHLLHTSGIRTGKAFIDEVTDGGHGRKERTELRAEWTKSEVD